MPRNDERPDLGVVAIGRNEGERLRRCLESVRLPGATAVYVDSGSQDGSVALARSLGVEVVELDLSTPFTAARARNEGWRHLRQLRPALEFVQFVDGDCELVGGWITAALRVVGERSDVAVVCGRVRERHREASIYNRLCDLEWNTPIGETDACGGNALMRLSALAEVGGFDPGIIAGEEPELCQRLRARGNKVLRIDADMVLHDAAMTRLVQWWRRTVRTGHGIADSIARNRSAAPPVVVQRMRSAIAWALVFPVLVLIGLGVALQRSSIATALAVLGGAALVLVLQTVRIALKRNLPGENGADAAVYAVGCMAAKVPQLAGMLGYCARRLRGLRPRLIEYK